jgi:mitochondrial translocator assembly and maintenance protein 41
MLSVARSTRSIPVVRRSAASAAVRYASTETPSSSSSQQSTPPPPPASASQSKSPPPPSNSPSLSRPHPAPRASTGSNTSRPQFRYDSRYKPNQHPTFQSVLPTLPSRFGQNQRLVVPDETRALLEEIVGQFNAPIRYAFAYGSGVFAQQGYEKSSVSCTPYPLRHLVHGLILFIMFLCDYRALPR